MSTVSARRTQAEAVPVEAFILTAGIVLQFMSGYSGQYMLPTPLDRPLILAGLGLAVYRAVGRSQPWAPRTIHYIMALFLGWVLISMAWSGSITSSVALFAWFDAVGLVPFAVYLVAPLVFSTVERRRVLLGGLTLLGAYLGTIALLEGLGLYELVWPRYIYNPESPHFGRAGGPARQVASNGLQLMGCGLAAAAFAVGSRTRRSSLPAVLVAGLCFSGTLFTMTRSIWLGVAVGLVAALCLDRRSIKWLGFAGVFSALLLFTLLTLQPAMREAVDARMSDSRSAFDRLNANSAALDVVLARPVHGLGFTQFPSAQADWLWQSSTMPITSTGIAVHNVLLGYAAELGLPGAALWLACLILPIIYLWRSPPLGRDAYVLRRVAIAYTVCWLVVGMLVPMTYPLPATLLWLFLALPTHPHWVGFEGEKTPSGSSNPSPAPLASTSSRKSS